MLCIRYCQREGCEVSGSPADLRGVAATIERLCRSGSGSVTLPADASQPAHPYDRTLTQFIIHVADGLLCASVHDTILDIAGSHDCLATFASFFSFDESTPENYHCHHEYFEGSSGISPASTPLVICVSRESTGIA